MARDYSYAAQSNLLAANDNLNDVSGAQLGFTYDGENRVDTASVTNLFGAAVANNTFTYTYDAATGRLSSQRQEAGGASFNGFDYA